MSGPGREGPAGDGEPRALEVVRAATGQASFADPGARWERAVAAPVPLAREPPSLGVRVEPERLLLLGLGPATAYTVATAPELARDLRECVPQALLRDLHRPVPVIRPVAFEEIPGTRLLGQWMDARVDLGEALRRDPPPRVAAITEVFLEDEARRRQLRAEPWQPYLKDDEERNPILDTPIGGSFF